MNYPFLQPIVLLIKFILRQRGLNETFTGGVSSYLVLNMVWAYFLYNLTENKGNLEEVKTRFNLGTFLKGFLQFYGQEFNYRDLGISIYKGVSFFSKWQRGFANNENLCFENFQEREKDIARGAYQFPMVVKMFREILYKLQSAKIPTNHSYLSLFVTTTTELKKRERLLQS